MLPARGFIWVSVLSGTPSQSGSALSLSAAAISKGRAGPPAGMAASVEETAGRRHADRRKFASARKSSVHAAFHCSYVTECIGLYAVSTLHVVSCY